MRTKNIFFGILLIFIFSASSFAQISPGELAKVHSHLEGMSKCTQCHTLGDKVSNEKCLACHSEIKERIDKKKGYHSSTAVKGKECASCHNDHHGKNFQIVKFETNTFDHNLTGFKLEGKHNKKKCVDCHDAKFITDSKIKSKTFTYLGLKTECLTCHEDYHQKTLSNSCANCHDNTAFKPAPKFNHTNSKFPLIGKHQTVECLKCHKADTQNGKKFQHFTGIEHSKCTNCHKDVHENKFGQNCAQCHTETSFQTIKGTSKFDHSKTNYKLEDKHINVNCKSCHKKKYTDPLKHDKCNDCHIDYHKNQFAQAGVLPDCVKCHTTKGFSPSLYTIEQHNESKFKLQNSHLATPCFDCHKKTENWSFREIGTLCADCHANVHKSAISAKYYPDNSCHSCHSDTKWFNIKFDHKLTEFELLGKHATTSCRQCHYKKEASGIEVQQFAGLKKVCVNCHTDKHFAQFDLNGTTDCNRCHGNDNWKAEKFNHNNAAFKLDGKHQNVACIKCHKPVENQKYILYKIKEYKCESCHF